MGTVKVKKRLPDDPFKKIPPFLMLILNRQSISRTNIYCIIY